MEKLYRLGILVFSVFVSAQNYPVSAIPENLLANANAIIRESNSEHIIKSVNEMLVKESIAITIMSAAGDDFSTVYIPYNPTNKVGNIKVELYDKNGKLFKTFAKKDFSDYTNNPSAALYVDDRILVLKPISSQYPYTVKTTYENNTSDTAFLNFKPVWIYNLAVEKSSFSILNNSGIKIRSKITDKPLAKLNVAEEGNLSKYYYENIPALVEEVLSPSIDYLVPKVEFSPEKFSLAGRQGDMTDWNSFGKWYYNQLLTPVSEVTPEIAAEVAALNLTGTTADKVKTLYQYMQNKTRYVLIAMGIGGWQPMPASEVSKKGYGDCKALTNYMRTLLAAAGIPSYFSIIYDGETVMSYDEKFPKFSGNHAILMVPAEDRIIWLENTSQKHAFNHLSYSSHNRNVLAVKENGIEIVATPIDKPEQSKEKLTAKVKISEDGSLTSLANFELTGGQYDQNLYLFGMKSDELQEAFKRRHYSLRIDEMAIQNLKNDKNDAKIVYDLNMKSSGFAKKLGNDIFFPVMPYYQSVTFSGNDERTLPFENSFPFQDDYEIEFTAPEGYQFSEIPAPSSITNEFGTYTINYALKDNKLSVHRILTIHKGLYPKEKFKDYVAFRKKTANNDNTKVLLTKKL